VRECAHPGLHLSTRLRQTNTWTNLAKFWSKCWGGGWEAGGVFFKHKLVEKLTQINASSCQTRVQGTANDAASAAASCALADAVLLPVLLTLRHADVQHYYHTPINAGGWIVACVMRFF